MGKDYPKIVLDNDDRCCGAKDFDRRPELCASGVPQIPACCLREVRQKNGHSRLSSNNGIAAGHFPQRSRGSPAGCRAPSGPTSTNSEHSLCVPDVAAVMKGRCDDQNQSFGFLDVRRRGHKIPPVGIKTSQIELITWTHKALLGIREYVFADKLPNPAFAQSRSSVNSRDEFSTSYTPRIRKC